MVAPPRLSLTLTVGCRLSSSILHLCRLTLHLPLTPSHQHPIVVLVSPYHPQCVCCICAILRVSVTSETAPLTCQQTLSTVTTSSACPFARFTTTIRTIGSSLDIAFLQWPFVPNPKRSTCPQLRQHPSCAVRNKRSMVGAAVSKKTLGMSPFSTKTTTKLSGNLQHSD